MQKLNNKGNRSKVTWKVVNTSLEKADHKQVLSDRHPAGLADEFNDYFWNIAGNLASKIFRDSWHHWTGISRDVTSLFLEPVTQ